jgi:hypothetical protein
MPTPWKESFVAHKTTIQFCNNTYMPLHKLTQKMQKAYCLANIEGKLLAITQYNLHMENFTKYRIVVQTCTQQVLGG